MICSLNEIEALARKAARGGGMSWGLAEETGKAVRWLSANGFPGPQLLAELLCQNDGKPYCDLAPQQSEGIWHARSGPLCPIVAGTLICDRAEDLETEAALRLGEVAVPLLLLPFASEAARTVGSTVTLEWRGICFGLEGGAPKVRGEEAALGVARVSSVALSLAGAQALGQVWTGAGRHVTRDTMEVLESFAQRTYAPATEESRAGAGAGQDND